MTNRCPHCNSRLPRTMHFVPPSRGAPTVVSVVSFVAVYGGGFFVLFHIYWPQHLWLWNLSAGVRLFAGAVFFAGWLALDGLLTSYLLGRHERQQEREMRRETRDNVSYSYDQELRLGDEFRVITTQDGQRRYLREAGFTVPAEPERGALSKWLWAVHDKKVSFSQRGARSALRDTPRIREWATHMLALWCVAGWANPVNGWNGEAPDLGNGVDKVDQAIVDACASGGYSELIERLLILVDESVEAPYSETERADPTGG